MVLIVRVCLDPLRKANFILTVCKLVVHCKRRGSEKSTFLAIFWGFLIFSASPVLYEFHNGQETKHVKMGHVKIDRAHFRVHVREHWKISREHWQISREHSRGSLRGDPLVCFTQKKPQPSWAFPWTPLCTLPCAFS